MWTISMLKQNARNSLNEYYSEGIIVCLVTYVGTVLILGVFLSFLFSPPPSAMLQFNAILHGPDDIKQMAEEAMNSIIRLLCMILFFLVLFLLTFVFYSNPMEVGKCSFFLKARNGKVRVAEVFHAFNTARYWSIVKTMFASMVIIYVSYILFFIGGFFLDIIVIIFGVFKSLEYMLVPFIISENAGLSSKRVKEISTLAMKGEKWNFFQLQLSFIGWVLLGILTCGSGFLFSIPYYQATKAEFYACMRAKMIAQGITTEEELTGLPAYKSL